MNTEQVRQVDIGDEVPDFTLESQVGNITFHDLLEGRWGLLLTFDKAFDPVATTEIGMICKLRDEFDSRNISVAFLGGDTVTHYREWISDIEELQNVKVNVPLIADEADCSVLRQYGCARQVPPTMAVAPVSHGVFLVDIDRRLRINMKYSCAVGRNMYEIIRAFDAMQLTIYHKVIIPANWGNGNEVMVHNDVTNEEANEAFEKGFVQIKPWFRITPAPDRA
jgi:thioredoxin-dependent peroxiredoxin